MDTEIINCPLGCDKGDYHLVSGFDRISGGPGSFDVRCCSGCGLCYTSPRPLPSAMGPYYPDNYLPYLANKSKMTSPDSLAKQSIFRKLKENLSYLMQLDSRAIPAGNGKKLLEIGCATGTWLSQAASRGWEVTGLEYSSFAAKLAEEKGLKIINSTVEDASLGEKFDLICAWMVLEHLHKPVSALLKMRSWIKPDGKLVFSIPELNDVSFKIFRDRWYALQLPCHLWHYTDRTIERMLDFCGWRIDKIVYHRNPGNLFGSCAFYFDDKKLYALSRFFRYLAKSNSTVYLRYLVGFILSCFKTSGRITVYASLK